MTGFSMVQVAPKWTEANAQPGGVLKTANGTGPYKFKSWSPNQDLVVESNEQYWGGAPAIKNVRMKIIGEQATRVAALRSGEVHVAKDMPPEEVDGINKGGRQTARAVASNRVPYLHLGGAQAAAGQREVAAGDQLRRGLGRDHPGRAARQRHTVSRRCSPPWTVGFDPTLKPYPYDPDKAKSLMKDAGFANGVDVNIWYQQGRYMKDKEVAEAFTQQLNKVGIRAKGESRRSQRPDAEGKRAGTGWPDLRLLGQLDLRRRQHPLLPLLDRDARHDRTTRKGTSGIAYGNTQFNDLITQARYTIDTRQAQRDSTRRRRRSCSTMPAALFMYNLTDIYGVDNWVKWEPRFDEMVWAYEMKWNE